MRACNRFCHPSHWRLSLSRRSPSALVDHACNTHESLTSNAIGGCGGRSYCVLTDDPDTGVRNLCTDVMRYASCASPVDWYEGSECEEEMPYSTFRNLADEGQGAQQRCVAGAEREFKCTYIVRRVEDRDICTLSEQQQDCMCEMGGGDVSCLSQTTPAAASVAGLATGSELEIEHIWGSLIVFIVVATLVVAVVVSSRASWRRVSASCLHTGFGVVPGSEDSATTLESNSQGSGSSSCHAKGRGDAEQQSGDFAADACEIGHLMDHSVCRTGTAAKRASV